MSDNEPSTTPSTDSRELRRPTAPPPDWAVGDREVTEVHETKGKGYEIRVLVTQDSLLACLSAQLERKVRSFRAADLEKLLAGAGITHGVDTARLEEAHGRLMAGESFELLPVAQGMRPENGKDGGVQLLVRPSTDEARFERNADGSVDHHNAHLFENVRVGDRIAVLQAPTDGRPGTTVYGRSLPQLKGRPASHRPGDFVRLTDDAFFAEQDGRLIVGPDGSLSISDQFSASNDVGPATGSIDFIGSVVVNGDVLDGYDVKAAKGLEIRGIAGDGTLRSGADIVVLGGVMGRGRGLVEAAGEVSAKYLNMATVKADGDVVVQREVLNSEVRSRGRLLVERGSIIGGCCSGILGMEVRELGSAADVPTRVSVGRDTEQECKQAELLEQRAKLQERLRKMVKAGGRALKEKEVFAAQPAERQATLRKLAAKIRRTQGNLRRVNQAASELRDRLAAPSAAQVNVLRRLHAGVYVDIGGIGRQFKLTYDGPLTLVQDLHEGTVRMTEYSELPEQPEQPEQPAPGQPPEGC